MAGFYVRPVGAHANAQDGLSYTTAWLGLAAPNWGGLTNNDIVYICGTFPAYTSAVTLSASASSGNPIVVSGIAPGYESDPGVIEFGTGGYFNFSTIDYYEFMDLTIFNSGTSGCFYIANTCTNINFTRVSLSASSVPSLALSQATAAYSDWSFTDCVFSNGTVAGFRYLGTTATTTSLTNISFENCTFSNNAGYGIEIRAQAAAVNFHVENLIINNCTFIGNTDGAINTYDIGGNTWLDCKITNNYCYDNGLGIIGASFNPSVAASYGLVEVSGNTFNYNSKPNGGINTFYCSYITVKDNICNDNYLANLSDVDGNGITIDYDTTYAKVCRNTCNGAVGTDTNINSGVGIMILECANCEVFNNICDGNRIGVWYGGSGTSTAHANNSLFNNTLINSTHYGLVLYATDVANTLTVESNIITGVPGSLYGAWDKGGVGNEELLSNNLIYGFDSGNYSGQVDPGNDLLEDPQLSADYFPGPQGPCIGSGTTLLSTYDFHSRPKVGSGNHIGAKWPKLGGSSVRRTF